MSGLVKGIASGIGLISEAITASKTKIPNRSISNPPAVTQVQVSETRETASTVNRQESGVIPAEDYESEDFFNGDDDEDQLEEEDRDEAYWELDELQAENPSGEIATAENNEQLLASFLSDHQVTDNPNPPAGRLSLPVILPQRRPNSRQRGFIRAYAPALEDCGIDQATFLDFLKTFHRMSQSSPWLPVVRVAALALFALPIHSIGTVGNLVIQSLVSRAMEMQRRSRTKTFLDKMNDSFFAPRGLYCMIMKYDPNPSESDKLMDINTTIAAEQSSPTGGFARMKKTYRNASGTYRETDLPKAAPLVFPGLENVDDEKVLKQTRLKSMVKFSTDYLDRRAQANFGMKFPDSSLKVESTKTFTSRYSDPTHPASNGTLLGLLSGGNVDIPTAIVRWRERREKRREERIERMQRRRPERQISNRPRRQRKQRRPRKIRANILYLMIVNMPSPEELEEAQALST